MDFTQALNFSCYVPVTGNEHVMAERPYERQGETPCIQSGTILSTRLVFSFSVENLHPFNWLTCLLYPNNGSCMYNELNFIRLVHLFSHMLVSFSLSQLSAFLIYSGVSYLYLSWWKPLWCPCYSNSGPLDLLFEPLVHFSSSVSISNFSISVCFHLQAVPPQLHAILFPP